MNTYELVSSNSTARDECSTLNPSDRQIVYALKECDVTSFLDACKNGISEDVKKIITNANHAECLKELMEKTDKEGFTLLHLAFANYNKSVAELCIKNNGNINALNKYNQTIVSIARKLTNKPAAKELVSLLKDQQIKTDCGRTALTFAIGWYLFEDQQYLLENVEGIVDYPDKKGDTPLMIAVKTNSIKSIELLIKHNCNTLSMNLKKENALFLAVKINKPEFVKKILEKTRSIDLVNPENTTNLPLLTECEIGSEDILNILLKNGADLSVRKENDQTVYHVEDKNSNNRMLAILIQKEHNRASIIDVDKDGNIPLHLATEFGETNTVKVLVNNGIDITFLNKSEKTKLRLAENGAHFEISKILVRLNTEGKQDKYDDKVIYQKLLELVNPKDTSKLPLLAACETGNEDILNMLLENGADVSLTNEHDQTVYHVAAANGKDRILEILLERDKNGDSFASVDKYGNNPLHLAAESGRTNTVKLLMVKGIDIILKNNSKRTALHLAASGGHLEISKILIEEKRVEINEGDGNEETPLHLACRNGNARLVSFLLGKGADLTHRMFEKPQNTSTNEGTNPNGRNALDLAIDHKHRDCVREFIQLKKDHWMLAFKNKTISDRTLTPMRKLIKHMPDLAYDVLDRCTTVDQANKYDIHDAQYKVTYNFELIDDSYSKWEHTNEEKDFNADGNSLELKKNHPLMLMVKYKREDLLTHPLVNELINLKWSVEALLIYFLYLSFLSAIIGLSLSYMSAAVPQIQNFTITHNQSSGASNRNACGQVLFIFLIVLSVLEIIHISYIVKQIIEVKRSRKMNCLEISFKVIFKILKEKLLVTIFIALNFVLVKNVWRFDGKTLEMSQCYCGIIAIFIGVFKTMKFAQTAYGLGLYLGMFMNVVKTFLKVFPIIAVLVSLFACLFNILMSNHNVFGTFPISLMKTIVMMTGEYEYRETFNSTESEIHYRNFTLAIFVIFIIIMTIIIMNLIVGLAVDDIRTLKNKALFVRQCQRARFVLEIESFLPRLLRERLYRDELKDIMPNKYLKHRVFRFITDKKFRGNSKTIYSDHNHDDQDNERRRLRPEANV